MDLLSLTSIEDILGDLAHFNVTAVNLRPVDIAKDLKSRIRREGNRWCFALLVGKNEERPGARTGMVLLRKYLGRDNFFLGDYYTHANCGGEDMATLQTIAALELLSEWESPEGLRNLMTFYTKLRVTGIDKTFIERLGNVGAAIEPLE